MYVFLHKIVFFVQKHHISQNYTRETNTFLLGKYNNLEIIEYFRKRNCFENESVKTMQNSKFTGNTRVQVTPKVPKSCKFGILEYSLFSYIRCRGGHESYHITTFAVPGDRATLLCLIHRPQVRSQVSELN